MKVHYTGKLEDGTVFDSSVDREPIEFTIGEGKVIPGFEKAVVGMAPEETKETVLPSEEAYGPRDDQRMVAIERDQLPPDLNPEVGMPLQMQTQEGQPVQVIVREVKEESITLDANHPLAGKDLTFELELVEVK